MTCSKSTIETLEKGVKYVQSWIQICSNTCVFIVNFEYISHLLSSVSFVDFEQVIVSWVNSSQGRSEAANGVVL